MAPSSPRSAARHRAGGLRRLDGHIAGAGTSSGVRLVLGAWLRSPWGAFADLMLARPDGTRVLYAPSSDLAGVVADLYTFDEVTTAPVRLHRTGTGRHSHWQVQAGPVHWSFTLGRRHPAGVALAAVPGPIARSLPYARALKPLAQALMPGVNTHGSARPGRMQWYGAADLHLIATSTVMIGEVDQGSLAPVRPSPSFGFGSVPQIPSVTRLSSLIRES